jgi:hypothetical protein
MVKITDGKTPPATDIYREGWERIFGRKNMKICPKCCGLKQGLLFGICETCNGKGEVEIGNM